VTVNASRGSKFGWPSLLAQLQLLAAGGSKTSHRRPALAAQQGKLELYKESHHFDGTYQNPQWLE